VKLKSILLLRKSLQVVEITLQPSGHFHHLVVPAALAWGAPKKIPRFGIGIRIKIDEMTVELVER
jgi:hypothetical protein